MSFNQKFNSKSAPLTFPSLASKSAPQVEITTAEASSSTAPASPSKESKPKVSESPKVSTNVTSVNVSGNFNCAPESANHDLANLLGIQSSSPSPSSVPTLRSLLGTTDQNEADKNMIALLQGRTEQPVAISATEYNGEPLLNDEGSSSDDVDDEEIESTSRQQQQQQQLPVPDEQSEPVSEEEVFSEKHPVLVEMEEGTSSSVTNIPSEKNEEINDEVKGVIDKPSSRESKAQKPNEQSNEGKPPPFDFQKFLQQFKSKECEPLHKYLRSFLYQFGQKLWSVSDQIKLIRDFQRFIFEKLLTYPPFNSMSTQEEMDNCKEGLEKLITSRLYNQIFAPAIPVRRLTDSHRQDLAKDKSVAQNMRLYAWIEPRHLDIPIQLSSESSFFKLASTELTKINDYRSPRDKTICILNCCKVIFGLIRQQQKQHKIEENADSFVPLLIYVILQSMPSHLHSNLAYIERFRSEEFLVGETSYYVSSLQVACNFIATVDKSLLTIEDAEFEPKFAQAKENLEKERRERREARRRKQEQERTISPIPKITGLLSNAHIAGAPGGEVPSQVLKQSAEKIQQSLSNLFSASPSPEPVAQSNPEQDLMNVKQLSIEENREEERRRVELSHNVELIQQMFPGLEKDIISDILQAKGGNIGEAVDTCLELM